MGAGLRAHPLTAVAVSEKAERMTRSSGPTKLAPKKKTPRADLSEASPLVMTSGGPPVNEGSEPTEKAAAAQDAKTSEQAAEKEAPRRGGWLGRAAPRRVGSELAALGDWAGSGVSSGVERLRSVPPWEAIAYGGLGLLAVVGAVELPVVATIAGVAWLTRRPGPAKR